MKITLTGVDAKLLDEQREVLRHISTRASLHGFSSEQVEHLEGISSLLEVIADTLAGHGDLWNEQILEEN
jgi:hypothetical protein